MKDYTEKFLTSQKEGLRVILVTERKTPSPIFKALSKRYKDKLVFGEIRTTLTPDFAQDLLKDYKIDPTSKLPLIFVAKSDLISPDFILQYTSQSDFDFESLSKYLKTQINNKFKRL